MTLSLSGRVALGGFTLDVPELAFRAGEVSAVLGPNGAGKTTLLRVLAGLRPLDAGRLVLASAESEERVLDDAERDIFVPASRRRVGVVFQDYRLFPHLTTLDNVAFGAGQAAHAGERRDSRRERRRIAADWLERMGLAEVIHVKPRRLSGGQAQRVALARALATDPEYVLLDEPLSALDVRTRPQIRDLLAEHLAGLEIPVVLVTHDPAEAFALAGAITVLEDGRVTQGGSPAELAAAPRTPYVAQLTGRPLTAG